MNPSELARFEAVLRSARCYLEYGAGGSTKLAARIDNLSSITSVESDAGFLAKLVTTDDIIADSLRSGRLRFLPVDIGPTGDWGYPRDSSKDYLWPHYALSPYFHGYRPDLVLLDGRFRVACGILAALHVPDATVLIHDYTNRHHYRVLEDFFDVREIVDTLVLCRRKSTIDEKRARDLLSEYLYYPGDRKDRLEAQGRPEQAMESQPIERHLTEGRQMTPRIETDFNRVKMCRYGQMVYNANDRYIGRSLELYGEFSEGETELFRQIVVPGHVVLDIGANIGTHTLFFSRQVGPTGRVLAFEPQRIVFQTLCANMALNSVLNAWCYMNAVGAEAGQILVPHLDYQQTNNFGGVALGDNLGSTDCGEAIPVIRIDDLGLRSCNLIKVDVEGMERVALSGAIKTIERFKPFLYVENDRAEKATELIRFIDSLHYDMYWHRPPLFHHKNYFNNPTNVFSNIISINLFCVHKTVRAAVSGLERVAVPE